VCLESGYRVPRDIPFHVYLASAVFVTGGLALLTSEPTSFAAVFWPPTGIALAAVLQFGRRALPSIAIGETVAYFALYHSHTSLLEGPVRLVVTSGVGILFAAQAAFGAWLIRRVVGFPVSLLHHRDVLKFLAIAGPVHTLPFCLVSGLAAGALGIRPWADCGTAVLEGWWGETVGGAIFGPITLTVIGLPATVWRPRRLTVAVPLLAFTAVTGGLLAVARTWDEAAVHRRVAADTSAAVADVRNDFDHVVQAMNQARVLIPLGVDLNHPVMTPKMRSVVENFRRSNPFVTDIAMATYVPADRLSKFTDGFVTVSADVRENGLREWEADGSPCPLGDRPWYAVVVLTNPNPDPVCPVGFDLASLPAVRAAWDGLSTNRAPILVRTAWPGYDTSSEMPLVLFVPLMHSDDAPIDGCLALLIDPVRLVRRENEADSVRGLRYRLVPSGDPAADGRNTAAVPFVMAGVEFLLVGKADARYAELDRAPFTSGVAIVGVGFSILLGSLLLVVTGRTAAVAEAVAARTAALHAEIASRAEIAESLRASETRLAEAQRIAHLAAWDWDADPDVLAWTDELTELLGPPPGPDPALADLLAFVRADDRDTAAHLIRGASERNEAGECEVRVRTTDGRDRFVVLKVVPVHGGFPGRILRGTIQDVTDRRRFEDKIRDTQRLESLGVLAGGVAHDFNNLLTGILGNASLVREELPPRSVHHESLRVIEQAADQAASLCQQMLAYAGRGPSVRGPVDPNRLVEESADLLRVSVHKKIDLRFDLAGNVPVVQADVGQLRQVLLNFVTNASEAINGQSGRITVRTGFGRPSCRTPGPTHGCDRLRLGDYAWFEVEDSGCGMAPDVMARVFEPFFTTKFTGRGLGLSAVHGIVRGHEGELCLSSTVGLGTTFRVYLPAAGDPAELLTRTPPPTKVLTTVIPMPTDRTVSHLPGGSGIIVVADDEPSVRAFAATALRAAGYDAREAADGYDAIRQVEDDSTVQLLVMDVTMPGMDGRETLEQLARLRPDLPVVLMSGYSEHELQDLFSSGTVAGFVAKPFRPGDLSAFVGRAIARAARVPAGR
jgi:signal transduction histidine kinase/CheY-like chemotaxis protein